MYHAWPIWSQYLPAPLRLRMRAVARFFWGQVPIPSVLPLRPLQGSGNAKQRPSAWYMWFLDFWDLSELVKQLHASRLKRAASYWAQGYVLSVQYDGNWAAGTMSATCMQSMGWKKVVRSVNSRKVPSDAPHKLTCRFSFGVAELMTCDCQCGCVDGALLVLRPVFTLLCSIRLASWCWHKVAVAICLHFVCRGQHPVVCQTSIGGSSLPNGLGKVFDANVPLFDAPDTRNEYALLERSHKRMNAVRLATSELRTQLKLSGRYRGSKLEFLDFVEAKLSEPSGRAFVCVPWSPPYVRQSHGRGRALGPPQAALELPSSKKKRDRPSVSPEEPVRRSSRHRQPRKQNEDEVYE